MGSTVSLCSAREGACTALWHSLHRLPPCPSTSSPPAPAIPEGNEITQFDQLNSCLAVGNGFPRASLQLCKSLTPRRAWLEGASSLPRLPALPFSPKAICLERAKRGPSKAMTNACLIPSRAPKETELAAFLTQAVTAEERACSYQQKINTFLI